MISNRPIELSLRNRVLVIAAGGGASAVTMIGWLLGLVEAAARGARR